MQKLHEIIVLADYTVWYYLNTVWHNGFLDAVIPYFRNQWTWAPLYLFLLVFTLQNFKRTGIIWCLFFLGTFAISDQLSAHVLKEIFVRIRPCNDPNLAGIVHNIVPCGSGYSFPSSHAANHFSLAAFMSLTLEKYGKWISWLSFFWAALVAYSQVYVGVHFPFDVFCGGLLGIAVGIFTAKIFRSKFELNLQAGEKELTSPS